MSTAAQKVSDLPGSLQKIVGSFQMVGVAVRLANVSAALWMVMLATVVASAASYQICYLPLMRDCQAAGWWIRGRAVCRSSG